MPTQTRILVAVGLGYVTYAFGEALLSGPIAAAAVAVVMAGCVFALTKPHQQD